MKKAMLVLGAMAVVTAASAQTFITIGSGSTTGVYFPIATGIARIINEADNLGIRANARSTGGSVFNINAIGSGELQMGLVQNDIAAYAFNGSGIAAFDGRPVKNFRSIGILYPEVVHALAREAARINTIRDLRGKRVVVGDVGSGTEQNTRQVLEAYGLKFDDLAQVIRVPPAQGVALLQDGRADAMFFTGGLGAAAIQQAAQTIDLRIVPVEFGVIDDLAKKYPFYVGFNIPSGVYKGVEVVTPSVAVRSMLVVAESLSADVVYNFTKAVFGNDANFKAVHPNLARYFSRTTAVRNLPVPLHPGAERFWKEVGVIK
ncbi:MAG: TAXI family TRAP transporter solute-binding subunit [Meiothermus sp.]|nr:TAXI family TRAP transporter solute-binding subunit [Meiothermus sp.]